jgi:hypothetical protein
MDSFAPEFSRFWLPMAEADDRPSADVRDDEAKRQREALEQLAERVSAARTIV